MTLFELPASLRNRSFVRHPHASGERSAKNASVITALHEHERTPLQKRLLRLHLLGECIGCTRQGVPINSDGSDLRFRAEPNGFAAPADYCDCPKGQMYYNEIQKRRATYDVERVQEHLRYVRSVLGPACLLSPAQTLGWSLETWPIDCDFPQEWTAEECQSARTVRRDIFDCVRTYADLFAVWDVKSTKKGLALLGSPGVGKSGLLRCLEPLMLARGYSMISLYVPDLLIALQSEQTEQIIAAIKATDIVLFDNLGHITPNRYKNLQGYLALIRLINARWEKRQRTFLTSAATEEQLREQLGEDTVSRLYALCRFFEVPGTDLRREGVS